MGRWICLSPVVAGAETPAHVGPDTTFAIAWIEVEVANKHHWRALASSLALSADGLDR